jgi:DNA-binding beta-propeller fold protein YncE
MQRFMQNAVITIGLIPSLVRAGAIKNPSFERPRIVKIPGGENGIGFDDIRFAPDLKKVIVPAGRTGEIVLIEPETLRRTSIKGFSQTETSNKGHDFGVTSLDEGPGTIFAIDRTARKVMSIDPVSQKVTGKYALSGGPDYVRYIPATGEVWVTEPDEEQIEVFAYDPARKGLRLITSIPVSGGPESLVIDGKRRRAFTHLWKGQTVVIDLANRRVKKPWDNGCQGSRGIAWDEAGGILLAGCSEGRIVALDGDSGRKLSEMKIGKGVDIIDFDPGLRHVYAPSGSDGRLSILSLSKGGKLKLLGTMVAERGVHCVTSDKQGQIYVCDPRHGAVIVFKDPFPAN